MMSRIFIEDRTGMTIILICYLSRSGVEIDYIRDLQYFKNVTKNRIDDLCFFLSNCDFLSDGILYPENMSRWTNVVLMLCHRRRRWHNIKTTLNQHPLCGVCIHAGSRC